MSLLNEKSLDSSGFKAGIIFECSRHIGPETVDNLSCEAVAEKRGLNRHSMYDYNNESAWLTNIPSGCFIVDLHPRQILPHSASDLAEGESDLFRFKGKELLFVFFSRSVGMGRDFKN